MLALGLVGCHHAAAGAGRAADWPQCVCVCRPADGTAAKSQGEAAALTDSSNYFEARLNEPAPLPVYPALALKAKARLSTIGVHITVDVNGHVSALRSSMLVFNTPGPFADDFRDAVESAVRQWRFTPARAEHFEIVHEGNATYNRRRRWRTLRQSSICRSPSPRTDAWRRASRLGGRGRA